MTTSARDRVAAFWDDHIEAWFEGEDRLAPLLERWFDSYEGVESGKPTRDGFPEPYHGDLRGVEHTPRMVVLGLNPGQYRKEFQSRDGIFAREIKEEYGSYSRWQTTCPYNRGPWTDVMGRNRYYRARLEFTRNWLQDPGADHRDLLIFESYPWHSTRFRGRFSPPPDVIDQFIWQPIAELPVRDVFAFGRSWHTIAESLPLDDAGGFDAGSSMYRSTAAGRKVRVHTLPSGQRLIVVWQPGYAGPPSAEETALLRDALIGVEPGSERETPPRARAEAPGERLLTQVQAAP
ncbi:anti-phage DNA glycosylase Brig1 [Micromonospora globbae]|jgi:hypothetical protein|uniref:anti-phage DNA glycosylase Brig1 n=1 Tax=Micromonospora globbae TaxID=1894969 RepID=UPI003417AC67|nr:hypothetical protein OH732_20170 [Micromonospora globbae]